MPQPTRQRGAGAAAGGDKVEQVAGAASPQSATALRQSGGPDESRGQSAGNVQGNQNGSPSGGQSSQSSEKAGGKGLALGQVSGGGNGQGGASGRMSHTVRVHRWHDWRYRDR